MTQSKTNLADMAEGREGRVVVPLDDPLALALRPSPETMERIEKMERANATAWQSVRNMPLGLALRSHLESQIR